MEVEQPPKQYWDGFPTTESFCKDTRLYLIHTFDRFLLFSERNNWRQIQKQKNQFSTLIHIMFPKNPKHIVPCVVGKQHHSELYTTLYRFLKVQRASKRGMAHWWFLHNNPFFPRFWSAATTDDASCAVTAHRQSRKEKRIDRCVL